MSRIEEHREVTGIVLFFTAVVVMLFFYLPVTLTGVLGEFSKSFFMGLFGFTAYAIPVYLLYAAIDFFFEKRAGVSRIRVVSVILFLISISSLLALITMDIAYISAISSEGEKVVATKALDLLWRSGSDASLIQNSALAMKVIPGGIIGGSIAIGLHLVTGKAIGIILLAVFLLAQIVTVFHISIKRAAKQTVNMIGKTAQKAYTRVTAPVKNTNSYGRPVSGTTVMTYGQNPNPYPVQRSASPFVDTGRTKPVNRYPAPSVGSDPFGSNFPIDAATGFTDVERMGLASGDENGRDTLNFNGRDYNTNEEHPTADFNYNAEPKNAPIRMKKQQKELTFLKDCSNEDFYDLTPQPLSAPEPEEPLDEMPSEVFDDDADGNDYDYSRNVRTPYVDPSIFGGTSVQAEDSITINAADSVEGYSETEGRMFKTSRSSKPAKTNTPVDFGDQGNSSRAIDSTGRAYQIRGYRPAPTKLLAEDVKAIADPNTNRELRESANKLVETLASFGINDTKVINIIHGPSITRFELTIPAGVKVSKVTQLKSDIMLAMAAISIRIEAPIPGKSAIGIELPNKKATPVHLRSLVETKEFKQSEPLSVALGRDIPGRPIYCNLAKMPHLMIAGSTGSGKSVCINSILSSILVHASPNDVRMILIDPKVVELSVYNGIPHLISPVITDCKKAAGALNWAVAEMQRRYKLFEYAQVRDIKSFNAKCDEHGESNNKIPLILIVIDELAELMMVASKEVETYISRLAALARAAGIHLLIATQRPSVDVITGVIKANIGSRIAFAVTSGVDSRTILDQYGAEELLGKGDMLYSPMTAPQPVRGQGALVEDEEVEAIVSFLNSKYGSMYDEQIIKDIEIAAQEPEKGVSSNASSDAGSSGSGDNLFEEAVEIVLENGTASVSVLQRRLGVGYPRAGKLIDELEKKHIIGPYEGSKPRKVLITRTEWLEIKAKGEENGGM